MKILKKALAALSASAMVFCISGITAGADASVLHKYQMLAYYEWVDYLEGCGIKFDKIESLNDLENIIALLDERGLSENKIYEELNSSGALAKYIRGNGSLDGRIGRNFINRMDSYGRLLESDNTVRVLESDDTLQDYMENDNIFLRQLEEDDRYIWNGYRWDYDYKSYLESLYVTENDDTHLSYKYTSFVSGGLAVSGTNKLVCQSRVLGNNKTTKIIATQCLEKLIGSRWSIIRAWSRSAAHDKITMTNNINVGSGSYRLKSVFKVYSGNNFETVTKYSDVRTVSYKLAQTSDGSEGNALTSPGDPAAGKIIMPDEIRRLVLKLRDDNNIDPNDLDSDSTSDTETDGCLITGVRISYDYPEYEQLVRDFADEAGIDERFIRFIHLDEGETAVKKPLPGDADGNGKINVRDAALIAGKLALGKADELPGWADYNNDGKTDIRDAADLAYDIAENM